MSDKHFRDKRKRSRNWLPPERELLINLVEKYYEVIENKKTDSASIQTKTEHWRVLASEYNAGTAFCPREPDVLKSQWESLKRYAKKDEIKARRGLAARRHDPVHTRILSLLKVKGAGVFSSSDGAQYSLYEDEEDPLHAKDKDTSSDCEDWHTYITSKIEKPSPEHNGHRSPLNGFKSPQIGHLSLLNGPKSPNNGQRSPNNELKSPNNSHNLIKQAEYNEQLLQLDLEIKREQLKQERLKTRLLWMEVKRKRLEMKSSLNKEGFTDLSNGC